MKVTTPIRWLVDALTDAAVALRSRFTDGTSYRIALHRNNVITDQDGTEVGRIADAGLLQWDPPGLATQMAHAAVTLDIPRSWAWRRSLPPIAIDNMAYLGTFVMHQIARISPWRAADVYFGTTQTAAVDDPTKILIEIGIVPQLRIKRVVDFVETLGGALSVSFPTSAGDAFTIPLGGDSNVQRDRFRRGIIAALSGAAVLLALWFGTIEWRSADLQAQLSELDREITSRKMALAGGAAVADAGAVLRSRRSTRPYVVEQFDELARAIPDHAYLVDLHFEKDGIRMSGVSGRASEVVAALERSGRFLDVKFAAATTRMDEGRADRFSLQMRTGGATAP